MNHDGRCFTYIFPCVWEDHCKIGFSNDPLRRIGALHRRWFEFFDLDRIVVVQTDTIREARDLELRLRSPLALHNAPPPSTVRPAAGGETEWFRGASSALESSIEALAREGHVIHPGRAWLARALTARSDRLFEWTLSQLAPDDLDDGTAIERTAHVMDALDSCRALGIRLEDKLAPAVWEWYRRRVDAAT